MPGTGRAVTAVSSPSVPAPHPATMPSSASPKTAATSAPTAFANAVAPLERAVDRAVDPGSRAGRREPLVLVVREPDGSRAEPAEQLEHGLGVELEIDVDDIRALLPAREQ